MTLKDFFHLSEEEFAERISKMSDEELMKDDIHNCRAAHSGAYGATIGALQAVPTAGISLVGSAIGLRRRNVAKRRLEMIHQEVLKRGLPIHQQTKRDYLIPLGISGISFGLSGVAEGLMHAVPVESLIDAGLDLGTSVAAQVAQEVAGKLTVDIGALGSEHVMDHASPGVGRSNVWKQKLSMSRSASSLSLRVVPSQHVLEAQTLSAPPSPSLGAIQARTDCDQQLFAADSQMASRIPASDITPADAPPALPQRPRSRPPALTERRS